MLRKPLGCAGCPLLGNGMGFSEPEGSGSLGVLILGEASGAAEEHDGLPFRPYAESGGTLERAFRKLGYNRDQFTVSNIVRCRPPHNELLGTDYEQPAIDQCKQYLDALIHRVKPKAILALGGIPLRTLTGMSGYKQGISALRGFVLDSCYGIPVVGSYHPAYLRRGFMNLLGVFIRDMKLVVDIAQRGKPPLRAAAYLEAPDMAQALAWEATLSPSDIIAYDIETAYSAVEEEDELSANPDDIIQIQFSTRLGKGIAFPWRGDYTEIARRILQTPNRKVGFNVWHFDNPKLRVAGAEVAGQIEDVMWAWHHLQPDLPRNLQFVTSFYAPEFGPWKHLASANLADYGCRDVDALQRIWPALERDLRSKGLWRGYERHVRDLWPILEAMTQRGLPISREKQNAFKADLEQRLGIVDAELQEIYPDHLKDVSPKAGFVRDPVETAGLIQIIVPDVTRKEKVLCECVDTDGVIGGWTKKVKERAACCEGVGFIRREVTGPVARWARMEPFKPSQQQLIRYMHYRGHKVPKMIGSDKDTTGKLFMERLAKQTKDPLYSKLLDYRSFQKMIGAYLEGWKPADDGRLHAQIKYSPATGQLAASGPNIMCFDEDTEVLTLDGWVPWKNYDATKPMAQFNSSTKAISFAVPLGLRKELMNGTLLNIRTEENIDLLLTPDHQCLLQNRKNDNFYKVNAANYSLDALQWQAGWYIGGSDDFTEAQVALQVALQADGYITPHNAIEFKFTRARKIMRMRWALADAGVTHYERHDRQGRISFYISEDDIPSWLKGKKFFGPWLLNFSKDAITYFAREIFMWDGSVRNRSYYSTHESNTSWAQTMLALAGYRVNRWERPPQKDNHNILYCMWVSRRPTSSTTNHVKVKVPYEGTIYCVSMPDTNVVVRRKGRIHITGNTMPSPKIGAIANTFRETIEATPGHCILAADYHSFHAVTLAFEAEDPIYMRIAQMDLHSFLTARMLKLKTPEEMVAMGDEELSAFLDWIKTNHKAIRDAKAKPTILGFGLGLGANKMFELNRDSFENKREAQTLIDTLKELFPKVAKYQKEVREQAAYQGYLLNKHGYIRWFFDVLYRDYKTGAVTMGDQAEAAIAFNVQCDAHGILKDAVLALALAGLTDKYRLINIVHDELLFEVPLRYLDEALAVVPREMEKPSEVLVNSVAPRGLSVNVDLSVGWNRGKLMSPKAFKEALAR